MTLLKNQDNLLPLSSEISSIAVVGPLANVKEFAYGDYSYPTHIEEMYYTSEDLTEEEVLARTLFFKKKETTYQSLFHDTTTILQEIENITSPNTQIHYAQGIKDTYNYNNEPDFYNLEAAIEAAKKSEVVIAVCGDTSGMGMENDSGESVDRVEIHLSHEQRKLLSALLTTGKPIVLVLCNGRPLELSFEAANIDAILEAWRPGMEGASAIVETLFGLYNPAGRLPITLPKCIGQLPIYYSQHSTGKNQFWRQRYLEVDLNPLYPFGYGLSYTSFKYDDVQMEQKEDRIGISLTVSNIGERDGQEVVQVYVRKRYCSVIQPERELKAFKRISVKAGETVAISFEVLFDSLCYHNKDELLGIENCTLDVMIGASSTDIRAEKSFKLEFKEGIKYVKRRAFTNSCKH